MTVSHRNHFLPAAQGIDDKQKKKQRRHKAPVPLNTYIKHL
jgi:hypothetical protein